MQTILPEFKWAMACIKSNFCISFLAVNFLKLGPFSHDVVLPARMTQTVMTSSTLNSISKDIVQDYADSIWRHFLNDMVITYERYSMLMIASHRNNQHRIEPALVNERLSARLFEQLTNVYQPDEVTFLKQLRRLRNSIVHYNGIYSATNKLNYTFGIQSYQSTGNEGQNIQADFDTQLWIYDRLMRIVPSGNARYLVHYPPP